MCFCLHDELQRPMQWTSRWLSNVSVCFPHGKVGSVRQRHHGATSHKTLLREAQAKQRVLSQSLYFRRTQKTYNLLRIDLQREKSEINLCLRSNTSRRGSHLRRGAKGENMRNFIGSDSKFEYYNNLDLRSAKLKTSKSRKNETNKREATIS